MKTSIAFIIPLDVIEGKSTVNCLFKFVAGEYRGKEKVINTTTDIFKYYFFGYTLETVVWGSNGYISNIRDIDRDDCREFNISAASAIMYNGVSQSFLASNGFVYGIWDSLFARYAGQNLVGRIVYEISSARNFSTRFYLLNGALLSINLSKNITEDKASYKYVLEPGFVPGNKEILRTLIPKTRDEFIEKEKLTQVDIDKILQQMREE